MSNAMSRHLIAQELLDEVLMTSDTTVYRALSGPGIDPNATGTTIHAQIVASGLTALLDADNLDTDATWKRRVARQNTQQTFEV